MASRLEACSRSGRPFVRLERPSKRAYGAPRDEGGEIPKTFGVANYFATVAVNVTSGSLWRPFLGSEKNA